MISFSEIVIYSVWITHAGAWLLRRFCQQKLPAHQGRELSLVLKFSVVQYAAAEEDGEE